MNKKWILLCALTMVLFLITGCGGSKEPAAQSGKATGVSGAEAPAQQPAGNNQAEGALARGQEVFGNTCQACHSTGSDKKVGPGLAGLGGGVLKGTGQAVSQEKLRQVLQQGQGSMPGGLVTGTNLENLLVYLKTL